MPPYGAGAELVVQVRSSLVLGKLISRIARDAISFSRLNAAPTNANEGGREGGLISSGICLSSPFSLSPFLKGCAWLSNNLVD